MDITNKTNRPLNVPLPSGKKLFLGPGKTGQVNAKALEHPALAKLIEAGDVEPDESEARQVQGARGKATGAVAGTGQKGTGAMRQSGDR